MEQVTLVFNNKVKECSLAKSNENTINISYSNSDYFRKNIKSIKGIPTIDIPRIHIIKIIK